MPLAVTMKPNAHARDTPITVQVLTVPIQRVSAYNYFPLRNFAAEFETSVVKANNRIRCA